MEAFNKIIQVVDTNITYCIPAMIICLSIIEVIFPKKYLIKKVLHIISGFIILYTLVQIFMFIYGWTSTDKDEMSVFIQRSIGHFTYGTMLFFSLIFPFSIFIKKLSSSFLYVFIVSVLFKFGYFLERYIIILSSMNRDHDNRELLNTWLHAMSIQFLQGFLIVLVLLIICKLIKKENDDFINVL